METDTLKTYNKLTDELIDDIVIHQTLSSLRRAGSVSPKINKVVGTKCIPTLYYILNQQGTHWTVHALTSDLCRFLLKGRAGKCDTDTTVNPTDPEIIEFVHSKINWDKERTGGNLEVAINSNGVLAFKGFVDYHYTDNLTCGVCSCDEIPEGNVIGVTITPTKGMIKRYPNVVVDVDGKIFGKEVFEDYYDLGESLHLYLKFNCPGEEIPIKITWSDDFEESFIVALTRESTLL